MRLQTKWVLLVAALLAGCGDDPKKTATRDDLYAREVKMPDGTEYRAEVVTSKFDMSRGMMFRDSLAADRGMLFDFKVEQPVMMWMKNTYIPLDMIFIGTDGRILNIAERNFYVTSSCGVCGKASIDGLRAAGCPTLARGLPKVPGSLISGLPDKLRAAQPVFAHTGGLHPAGLFDTSGNLVAVREDVGRHNAVDKLIGAALLGGKIPLSDNILMLSGRISFELVQKSLMAGIPIVAAVGAPSSLAIETALHFGLTLAGFVRGQRYNVYAGQERLI